ncbi:MAG: hypothetical protein U1A78_17890 [Polyangia bacterium]
MIADPRALARSAKEPRTRVLAHLACAVTEAPWSLGPADLEQARAVGLLDEAILQVVLLASLFGHLNRIADAVGIELDYRVVHTPPAAVPATPPYARPEPAQRPPPEGRRALELALRPAAVEALAAWQRHALLRDAPLDRRQRALIRGTVAECLGDRSVIETAAPASALDAELVRAAEESTLTPWRLGAATVARLRAAGLPDDAAVFDALATAASCTAFSRIPVALAALGA